MCGIWAYIGKYGLIQLFDSFKKISGRGPENFSFNMVQEDLFIGFHRLAINGLSGFGNQPFIKEKNFKVNDKYQKHTIYTVCNGEIYNYKQIIENNEFDLQGKSDCEVLPFLYMKYQEDMIKYLDGEFAFIMFIINNETHEYKVFCGRDPLGVRPLFYGTHQNNLCIGSELKCIEALCQNVKVFPPGYTLLYKDNQLNFQEYYSYDRLLTLSSDYTLEETYQKIREVFTRSVKKRLSSERPLGCLLSGGLDSSIVSAVTSRLFQMLSLEDGTNFQHQLRTFTIGLEGATDIKYAELVAKKINSKHTTFIVTIEEALKAIDEVIYTIESYDCTTVRASVWQYLLGKKIRENTDIKVLLTGEGSDELTSGYMYFHNAPSKEESHIENVRLLKDIHRFDGLRVDRAMSCHGLEVRIPFLDPEFIELYLSLDKKIRCANNEGGMEKQLFRDAFRGEDLLPIEVLYRKKEAFSDGTSSNEKSWYEHIQEHIDRMISNEEYEEDKGKYEFNKPDSKEKYYYRKVFEFYFGKKSEGVIPYYWLPKWSGNITEPSARVLDVYKKK
jgi:asparagine synthase (glutamine-hydrolysing)